MMSASVSPSNGGNPARVSSPCVSHVARQRSSHLCVASVHVPTSSTHVMTPMDHMSHSAPYALWFNICKICGLPSSACKYRCATCLHIQSKVRTAKNHYLWRYIHGRPCGFAHAPPRLYHFADAKVGNLQRCIAVGGAEQHVLGLELWETSKAAKGHEDAAQSWCQN